ncbi:MAG: hypothetical protein ACO3YZ_04730 [Candidatus Nanopelagicaceae bacterium]
MTYSFGDGQPAMDIDGNTIETEKASASAPTSVPVPRIEFNPPAEYGISSFTLNSIKREKLALISTLYNLEIAFVLAGARFKGVEYQLLQGFCADCLHKIHPIILYWAEHEMQEDIVLNLEVSFGAQDTNKDILARLHHWGTKAAGSLYTLNHSYNYADSDGHGFVDPEKEALAEAIPSLEGIVNALERMLS